MTVEKGVKTDIIVIGERQKAVRLEVAFTGTEVTPETLRALVRERLGINAILLHDGGLSLGLASAPVLMEASEALPKDDTTVWHLPPHSRPWQRPGWFTEVRQWLKLKLEVRDEHLSGAIQQISSNDLTCVLRAETDKGGVYLKANETHFEARVTATLARRHPDLTPEVLAHHEQRGWLVTRAGGTWLSTSAVLEDWQEALRKLAHFQRSGYKAELKRLGCPEHTFDDLFERSSAFFRDRETLSAWGLSKGQRERLEGSLPQLKGACARIRALGLPNMSVHGDAQPMNALSNGARWFDWSEAATAHPFTDIGWCLAWILNPARDPLPVCRAHGDAPAQLWRTYLQALDVQGADDLLEDTMLTALAHRALVYHHKYMAFESTLQGWRPQYVPYYLKLLLRLAERRG